MILLFKPCFKEKILTGVKTLTIREDLSGKWKPGVHIDHSIDTDVFATAVCTTTDIISIDPDGKKVYFYLNGNKHKFGEEAFEHLWKSDGFDTEEEFWDWFCNPFSGKIIHWNFSQLTKL